MTKTIVGYFDDLTQAERGVRALVDSGFSRDDISLIASDPEGEYSKYGMAAPTSGEPPDSGVLIGASTRAILGSLGGLLAGLGALPSRSQDSFPLFHKVPLPLARGNCG
jgi:hypothetical protein